MQSTDAFLPHNRAASMSESLETLLKDLEKKLKITNTGMDRYKIEPVLSLMSPPPSPRQSRKPSDVMNPHTSTPNIIYDGLFIQSSTFVVDEIEKDVVLKWFFKEDSTNKEIRHCEISLTRYGPGYKMIQRMGYSSTSPWASIMKVLLNLFNYKLSLQMIKLDLGTIQESHQIRNILLTINLSGGK